MRVVNDVPAARWHVVMQRVRELLVVIRDHRVLLAWIEVLRLVEQTLKWYTIGTPPAHQLHSAPLEVLLLRVGVGNFRQARYVRTGIEIWKVDEPALGDYILIGIGCLERCTERDVLHHKPFRSLG